MEAFCQMLLHVWSGWHRILSSCPVKSVITALFGNAWFGSFSLQGYDLKPFIFFTLPSAKMLSTFWRLWCKSFGFNGKLILENISFWKMFHFMPLFPLIQVHSRKKVLVSTEMHSMKYCFLYTYKYLPSTVRKRVHSWATLTLQWQIYNTSPSVLLTSPQNWLFVHIIVQNRNTCVSFWALSLWKEACNCMQPWKARWKVRGDVDVFLLLLPSFIYFFFYFLWLEQVVCTWWLYSILTSKETKIQYCIYLWLNMQCLNNSICNDNSQWQY